MDNVKINEWMRSMMVLLNKILFGIHKHKQLKLNYFLEFVFVDFVTMFSFDSISFRPFHNFFHTIYYIMWILVVHLLLMRFHQNSTEPQMKKEDHFRLLN